MTYQQVLAILENWTGPTEDMWARWVREYDACPPPPPEYLESDGMLAHWIAEHHTG